MRIILLVGIFFGIFHTYSFSQKNQLRSIDKSLTRAYRKANTSRNERLETAFEKMLLRQLKNSITFEKRLDSLATQIGIKASSDNKIKFYNWSFVGGSSHNIICVAQFKSDKGNLIVQKLSAEGGDEDCGIYEAHRIDLGNLYSYLTFAWGTHGGGLQFITIRVFKIVGSKFGKCISCIKDTSELTIEYPRSSKLNLNFNKESNEISYAEFKEVQEEPEKEIVKQTGKTITLKLINGVFTSAEKLSNQ